MSDPKGLRRRRRAGVDEVPRDLAEWFAGEAPLVPESAVAISEAQEAILRRMRPEALTRAERRAIGLPIEARAGRIPWAALIYPDYMLLPERWLAWKADHPKAAPPAGFEWLDDPNALQHPTEQAVEQARNCAAGARRKS